MLKEGTLLFKILIGLDRLLNVVTGGSFQECLSTRSHLRAIEGKPHWVRIRNAIDWVFWDGHCKDSFKWEMKIKKEYIIKHGYLLESTDG